jgi:hypothetical protein
MLHDDPKSAFLVGFGGGTTTKAMTLTSLESIRVVELEPTVVEAGRAISGGEIPTLQDPRVRLDFNDARNTLLVENTKYDIIASQPSHPWLARASNVFSRDFFTLAKSRLNQGGIYAQWVSLFQMDATTLKSLLKAFYEVFPEGMTFASLDTGDFIMFGSANPMVFDFNKINRHLSDKKIASVLKNNGINNAKDLMLYFALSRDEALTAAGDTPANTDLNILSEVRLSKNVRVQPVDEDPYKFLWANYTFNVETYLADDYVQRMYEIGSYYADNKKATTIARYTAKQVSKLNPVLGRGMAYEKLWRRSKYSDAIEFYNQHQDWPDRTHVQQALTLSNKGFKKEAMQVITRIQEQKLRHTVKNRLLSSDKGFSELQDLKNKGDIETIWQKVGFLQ